MNEVKSFRGLSTQLRFIKGETRLVLLLSMLLVLVTAGLFALMASAATSLGKPVYGPETFNPGLYFRFFQLAAPTGQYTLYVQNGNPQTGQNRVNSVFITLNGKIVDGLSDLNTKIASVSKTVALKKLNVITLLVAGKKGTYMESMQNRGRLKTTNFHHLIDLI